MSKSSRKPGRPKIDMGEETVHFGIRITKSTRDKMEKLARIGNRSVTHEGRAAIDEHIEKNSSLLK